jgi:UDP-GlcNAc:undecaprenyl-phosphate GlcNAc-1-phosphate transferase
MIWIVLILVAVACSVSLPLTWLMRALGHRLNALDSPGVAGQVKAARRKVPNLGGIAVFWAFALPALVAIAAARFLDPAALPDWLAAARPYLPGLAAESVRGLWMLAGLTVVHIMGLIDDRRPLGPFVKLSVMVMAAAGVVWFTDTRLLTMLDGWAGGTWLSIVITIMWFVVVTNAMNFMDNMDGLSGGTGAIASSLFLAAALVNGQWFVAGCLALLTGGLLGFLWWNFPRKGGATIFLGDGGSLVIGFLLAFLTTRTTYVHPTEVAGLAAPASHWYGVLMPLVVLAIPLYDFTSVVVIRLSQGRSPFVGDLQHFSHRLVRLGLSKRAAVCVIYGFTAVTGVAGISLGSLAPWQAVLVGLQVLLILLVLAVFERARAVGMQNMQGESK